MEKPIMHPPTGERLVRFVGDHIRITIRRHLPLPPGWTAWVRTSLGKAESFRKEIISSYAGRGPLSVAFWRDVAMEPTGHAGEWGIELPMTEPGFFRAKAYLLDPEGRQHWPEGFDLGLSVHPDSYRTANIIYCAFTRMFGETKTEVATRDEKLEHYIKRLDHMGYVVIPPSGKLRDLSRSLPHITETLGCRFIHLLPVSPTPTTFARFGRFGSPYACQDLTAIDPALVEFDQRTTGVEQFMELTHAVHQRGARVILDIVINHTGWGATLYEQHPEWFLREANGMFASPGAWGIIWGDLVELDPEHTELWEHLAEAFLVWCRRGVDGFRCDAGYKVPLPVWQYIEARVRQEFPDTLFLLEGLGGAWEFTERLLTEGGMQWAYSELFQNYSGSEVANYLDHTFVQSNRVGVLAHYSETHDNDRLAKKGKAWSLMRNRLSALASVGGAFGYTCGVEWLATEKIEVHQSRGLSWGSVDNIVPELAQLSTLLSEHPCFFDGATCTRLSPVDSAVYVLRRDSAENLDHLLVLVNTDTRHPQSVLLDADLYEELSEPQIDLLGQPPLRIVPLPGGKKVQFDLEPGAVYCLSSIPKPEGLSGDKYRLARAQAAWGVRAMSHLLKPEEIGSFAWRALAARVEADPAGFLASIANLAPGATKKGLLPALDAAHDLFPKVVTWTLLDRRRITPVPPGHWILLHDSRPFRATIRLADRAIPLHLQSIPVRDGHVAYVPPQAKPGEASLSLERYALTNESLSAQIRFLAEAPRGLSPADPLPGPHSMVLLTNGTGAMARMCVDLGRVRSKYDCVLGANLHAFLPVDRHVFVKRLRVWVNAGGFITPLSHQHLRSLEAGPPAVWHFVGDAGDGRTVEIDLTADMLEGRNTTVLRFSRPAQTLPTALASTTDVRLTVRIDIEDRNFHSETHNHGGTDHHFSAHTHALKEHSGFAFAPSQERQLRVFTEDRGWYHPQPEWSHHIDHAIEKTRGQVGEGDAYSPGWFELLLHAEKSTSLVLTADGSDPTRDLVQEMAANRAVQNTLILNRAKLEENDSFGRQLALAAQAFVVRRGSGKTVIAGYPWFLDWGRDSLIAARGLLAAGRVNEVAELLIIFGRFVEHGTMPNTIHGEDASNRDTSDAPLWYGVVCEEAAPRMSENLYAMAVDKTGRTVGQVLREIAEGYIRGTPNGIRLDPASGLIWSPGHFTWMDTNYPAGTPREGYPVEIQVLWIRLLRHLERLSEPGERFHWAELAERAEKSLLKYFWLEQRGYLADLLIAGPGIPAAEAMADTALRSNFLFAIALGFLTGDKARRSVDAALRYLVVPGALRSLAPLPVSPPLPIRNSQGQLLNNPDEPYWGHYEGDEDTRRKPAYHNGTAWTWTFPSFCEALARAWDFSPASVAAARSYLGSMEAILKEGCVGNIPEILDGDAPHQQRGCDAQAWGVTEALRVWKLLKS